MTHLEQVVLALIGVVGMIFGSGSGVWAYLTWRRKAHIEAEMKTLTEQRKAVRLATETMQAAMSILQSTVDFLKTRLRDSNAELLASQQADAEEAKTIKRERNGFDAELERRLRVAQAQYADTRHILAGKTGELETAHQRISVLTAQLLANAPTKPLKEAKDEQSNRSDP